MNSRKYIFIILLFLIPFTFLLSEEWHVKKSKNNLVKFISSTPVLDFEGITQKIDGYIYWEGEKLFGNKNEIYFEVDLNSVNTGSEKRDVDMREDVLQTDKWPITYYKGTIIKIQKVEEQNLYELKSKGKIFIHGVEKEIEITAKAKIENNIMNITTDFSVYLKDFNIKAPSLLAFIKVAQEIKLHLDFTLEKFTEDK